MSRNRWLKPFQEFAQSESAGGIVLACAAAVALLWANLASASYVHLKELPLGLRLGPWDLQKPLEFWVNDGLMAVFFLLVGLEVKREMLIGELAGLRRAMLPILAALGGMIVPAAIYASLNWGTDAARGWGIPMATDIAFALGVLSLLGRRLPVGLKVFLTALAIVDDLGAVLVIALFYTQQLHLVSLGLSIALALACFAYGRLGGRRLAVFLPLGAVLWFFMLRSGVHATVAGVLLAMTIPIASGSHSPLRRLEHALESWAAYGILPIFALLNAGVPFKVGMLVVSHVTLGVSLGLLVGKPVGIVGFSWLAARIGLVRLPDGANWRTMIGIGLLGGIGFTMSLFINALAFPESELLYQAKLGVLLTSTIAAVLGLIVLRYAAGSPPVSQD